MRGHVSSFLGGTQALFLFKIVLKYHLLGHVAPTCQANNHTNEDHMCHINTLDEKLYGLCNMWQSGTRKYNLRGKLS